MAGMFYSLQEAAKSLSRTEEQVKELVKDGKLREFRDGANVLFKVDEVKSLMSDTSIMAAKKSEPQPDQQPQEIEEDDIALAPENDDATIDIDQEPIGITEETIEPAIGETALGSELTDADTAIPDEGINVLGETDSDYQITDDTMAETRAEIQEASLEEIEEDVNLDTFGSGSGLLDLSLQADDTSLGGILDEIYTSEDEGQEAGSPAEAMDITADTEEMLAEGSFADTGIAPAVATAARAYMEPEPDLQSNTFGIVLVLPLLAVLYTAVVIVASLNNVIPSVLTTVQAMIWYVMIGIAVAAVLIVGIACMAGGGGTKKPKKPKPKKEKKPKKKKSRKGKKSKKDEPVDDEAD